VSPVKYELGFYIPEDDILRNISLHVVTFRLPMIPMKYVCPLLHTDILQHKKNQFVVPNLDKPHSALGMTPWSLGAMHSACALIPELALGDNLQIKRQLCGQCK
jgi:hypothetical protein